MITEVPDFTLPVRKVIEIDRDKVAELTKMFATVMGGYTNAEAVMAFQFAFDQLNELHRQLKEVVPSAK